MTTKIEVFPHEYTQVTTTPVDQRTTQTIVRYRFVPILAPDGWVIYPGQQCHDLQDGLLIEDSKTRWHEEDLWGARCDLYCLDIGCYGGRQLYVCHAHTPDWEGELLERREFLQAELAAAWAIQWLTGPENVAKGIRDAILAGLPASVD